MGKRSSELISTKDVQQVRLALTGVDTEMIVVWITHGTVTDTINEDKLRLINIQPILQLQR